MKKLITTTLIAVLSLSAFGQEEDDGPVLSPTLLFDRKGEGKLVYLEAATDKAIRYRVNKVASSFEDARIATFKSIYVYDPDLFIEAKDLYETRKYEDALKKIKEVQTKYAPIAAIVDGPVAKANFLELECYRKLSNLKELDKALRAFDKGSLTSDIYQRQLQIYLLWDKLRNEEWNNLTQLAEEYADVKLTGEQRAQVAYCNGVALEKIQKPQEALFQYQIVITADGGASEVVAADAALRILGILQADPAVKEAKVAWDAEGEPQPLVGTIGLHEAAAVAKLYEMSLGGGKLLPSKYTYFLKYSVEQPDAAEEKPAPKEEKKEDK